MQLLEKCLGMTLLCMGAQAACAVPALAKDSIQRPVKPVQSLPNLHANEATPGHFQLDDYRAAIGYDERDKKWNARIDGYLHDHRSLGLDYGTLLSERVGAGVTLTHRDDYSEVLINGIYAPQEDVRLQISSGQQRNAADPFASPDSSGVLQNSYLVGVRRQWDEQPLSPDVGVAAYTVEASGSRNDHSADAGNMQGYMLNLSIQPTPQTRIEWRHDLGRLTQRFDEDERRDRSAAANRIGYLHQFDNCVRLHGRLSAGAQSGRLELGLARKRWNIGVARTEDNNGGDMSVRVGYRIPLGGARSNPRSCKPELETTRPFRPMVDVVKARPEQLPQVPITEGDAALSSGALAP